MASQLPVGGTVWARAFASLVAVVALSASAHAQSAGGSCDSIASRKDATIDDLQTAVDTLRDSTSKLERELETTKENHARQIREIQSASRTPVSPSPDVLASLRQCEDGTGARDRRITALLNERDTAAREAERLKSDLANAEAELRKVMAERRALAEDRDRLRGENSRLSTADAERRTAITERDQARNQVNALTRGQPSPRDVQIAIRRAEEAIASAGSPSTTMRSSPPRSQPPTPPAGTTPDFLRR